MFVKTHKQYDNIIITLLLYITACIEFQYHANIVEYYSVATQKYACHTNAVIRVTTSKISGSTISFKWYLDDITYLDDCK